MNRAPQLSALVEARVVVDSIVAPIPGAAVVRAHFIFGLRELVRPKG